MTWLVSLESNKHIKVKEKAERFKETFTVLLNVTVLSAEGKIELETAEGSGGNAPGYLHLAVKTLPNNSALLRGLLFLRGAFLAVVDFAAYSALA